MGVIIRKAGKKDLPSVLSLIKELATYEKAPNEVKVTLKELEQDGFGRKKIYDCFVAVTSPLNPLSASPLNPLSNWRGEKGLGVVWGEVRGEKGKGVVRGEVVGMALYYTKYSTWKGKCIFLDDIIVTQSMRGQGIGKKLFEAVITVAKKMKVRKLEWQVLNWNETAINFYKKYSTVFDNEWINCKLVFEK